MQSLQTIDLQQQIEEASKKAKPKKALYLYDETGNRELLGVFSQKKADQIRKYLIFNPKSAIRNPKSKDWSLVTRHWPLVTDPWSLITGF